MTYEVVERYVPLDGDRADDAHADMERLRRQHAANPNVLVVAMVETRSLAHRTPRTTAKWCAVIHEAKKKPLSDPLLLTIRQALEASYHIAECGDHREHLLDAENKAREALAACDALEARIAELERALRDQGVDPVDYILTRPSWEERREAAKCLYAAALLAEGYGKKKTAERFRAASDGLKVGEIASGLPAEKGQP